MSILTEQELNNIFGKYLEDEVSIVKTHQEAADAGESPETAIILSELNSGIINSTVMGTVISAILKTIAYNNRMLATDLK